MQEEASYTAQLIKFRHDFFRVFSREQVTKCKPCALNNGPSKSKADQVYGTQKSASCDAFKLFNPLVKT